jgi:hypothetical protein
MCLVLLYFMDCLNLNCNNKVYSDKHLRCSKCRHQKVYECCSCGTGLNRSVNRTCSDCKEFRRLILRYQYRINKCLKCDTQMGRYGKKWCSMKCKNWAISRSTKSTPNCKVCDKDIILTGKHSYCSDECYMIWRKIYLRARSRKCHV